MTPQELFFDALSELNRIVSMSMEEQLAWMRSLKTLLPPMVPAPNGGSLLISEQGAKSLRRLSDRLRESNPTTKASTSLKKHFFAVQHAFCRTAGHSKRDGVSESGLFPFFLDELKAHLVTNLRNSEHFFPCHLFIFPAAPEAAAFEVGPVRFVSRQQFLREVKTRGPESEALVRELDEQPGLAGDETAALKAKGMREAMGNCQWVAAVTVRNSDSEMSVERASTCVRLALAIVRLSLGRFEANRVRIDADPHLPLRTHHLSAGPSGEISISWRFRHDGLPAKPEDIAGWVERAKPVFDEMGQRLTPVADPITSKVYPAINEQWLTALYWFARGCNETSDVDAVVAFGACFDAVTAGKGSEKEIANGIGLLLRLDVKDRATSGGMTLEGVVERLYCEGRSRLIHGGRSPHFEDLEDDRSLGGAFSQYALTAASEAISDYTRSAGKPDEYRYVLKVLKSKK